MIAYLLCQPSTGVVPRGPCTAPGDPVQHQLEWWLFLFLGDPVQHQLEWGLFLFLENPVQHQLEWGLFLFLGDPVQH